jgi:hypothetical protein
MFGRDVNLSNQFALVQSAVNKGIDAIRIYNKKDLDKNFLTKNAGILTQKRGAGYWLWKPYIILKTLESIPENDVLLYVDAGIKIIKDITPLINFTKSYDMIFFESGLQNHTFIKRDAMVHMGMDDEKYLDESMLMSGIVFFKNTKTSRNFVKEWLRYCENPAILTDIPSKHTEFTNFKDNRHDQTVLSLLHLKNPLGQFVHKFTSTEGEGYGYFDIHRRRFQIEVAGNKNFNNEGIALLVHLTTFIDDTIKYLKDKIWPDSFA